MHAISGLLEMVDNRKDEVLMHLAAAAFAIKQRMNSIMDI